MSLPEKSKYPVIYDTEYELKTAVDGLYSKITSSIRPYDSEDDTTYNWENGEGVIDVLDNTLWPNSGYATVYLKENHGNAIERATLFHYGLKGTNTLENVTIIEGQKIIYFPEDSIVVQNVVAENHNYNKDAIIELEKYLGNRGTEDQSTIEWFTEFYVHNIRVPKPWISLSSTLILTGDYITIQDMTTRIKPGFTTNLDSSVEWFFDLGDQTTILISLDVDTREYVFDISYINSNGDNKNKQERKTSWNRSVYHQYKNSGVYNISLNVKNEFGSDQIILQNAIRVINNAPKSLSISVSGDNKDINKNSLTRVEAKKDNVHVTSKIDLGPPGIVELGSLVGLTYLWDIPYINQTTLSKFNEATNLNLSFDAGGMYYIGLKVVAPNLSWIGAYIDNAIDVVERPSVWLAYVAKNTGQFSMNEYSIISNTWKENSSKFNLNYSYDSLESESKEGTDLSLSFRSSRGLHARQNTDDEYLFWAPNSIDVNVAKFNCMTNAFSNEDGANIFRLYNWYTLYIPVFDSSKVYVLGGLKDRVNKEIMNQDIMYYDLDQKTFFTIEQNYIIPLDPLEIPYTSAFTNAREMIKNPGKYLAKWKSTSYENKGYILRNSDNGILEDLFSFDPSINMFTTLGTSVPFSRKEVGFNALNDGIYTISNAGDVHRYDPANNTWSTTTQTASDVFASIFHADSNASRNSDARVITGVEPRTINSSNTSLYFTFDYGYKAFGKFDSSSISFQQLSERPYYDSNSILNEQWDMIVF